MRLDLLLSLLPLAAAVPTSKRSEPAPLLIPRSSNLVTSEYIVKFKQGSPLAVLEESLKMLPGKPTNVFDSLFKGFSGKFDASTLSALRAHPDVEYVEQNARVSAFGLVTQSNSPWGLSRISHRQAGSPSYVYDDSAGRGVCAYIIDSGLDDQHPDFEGRAKQIKSFNGQTDTCGHGTHVAGTIGSKTYGVAKKTQLYGVKVLDWDPNEQDCLGSWDNIISGMDFVAKDAAQRNCPNGVVVNMSLGGDKSQAVNDAAAALVRKGIFVAVAAGNSNKNADGFSPASEPTVCTVGGTASNDRRYNNSNWGPSVDILGPAVGVQSTLPSGRAGQLTGTSMASPHIAGLAAYLASKNGQKAGPRLCQTIQQMATKDAIVDQPNGTVNLLAFNGNPSG